MTVSLMAVQARIEDPALSAKAWDSLMRFRTAWMWLALWLSCTAFGVHAQAPASGVIELTRARVVYKVAGETAHAAEAALPYHWDRMHQYRAGEATFELPFTLSDEPDRPYGLFLPRVGSTAEIWLNGLLLERLGDINAPNTDDFSKAPQYVPIPVGLLERDNVLRVHIRADAGRRGGLSTLWLGPSAQVRAMYSNVYRWRVSASMVVTIFSVLVGGMALALWATQTEPGMGAGVLQRRDNIYLAAGLAELCWALRVGDVAIDRPPIQWPVWGVVVTVAFAGWLCGIALFCHRVAGWHRHRSMSWFSAGLWALFGSSVLAGSLAFWLHQPLYLTAWLGLANVLFIGYALVYLWGAWRQPEPTRLLVAAAGLLNVAMGVRDWVAIRISGSLADNTWIRYSSVLFGLVLGYIVVTRFRAASAQARDLMSNLAARVAEKESALQHSYERLEQLAREQERTGERARILRDMHDGVGSHISAAIRQLESGRGNREQVLQTLRDSLDQLKLSIDAMNLPPGDITTLLANMRYRLAPRFEASDIVLQWDVDQLEPVQRLDANAMRQLQFMLFEALSNVLQHAQATELRIEARALDGGVRLRIVDNGVGFDVGQLPTRGLRGLNERGAAIGAVLTITSAPGQTVVEIMIA